MTGPEHPHHEYFDIRESVGLQGIGASVVPAELAARISNDGDPVIALMYVGMLLHTDDQDRERQVKGCLCAGPIQLGHMAGVIRAVVDFLPVGDQARFTSAYDQAYAARKTRGGGS